MVNCMQKEKTMDKDCSERGTNNFAFSCFEDDDGPYFDMDFSPSPSEENIRDSKEFEFSISMSARNKAHLASEGSPDDVSPADDLFYKGQLLPLHLPPRLQMVRNLSMSRESEAKYLCPDTRVSAYLDIDNSLSSGYEDSNKRPISCGEAGISSAKTKTRSHSILKSATKFKVSLFGFRKSSKVGMDDHYSTNYSLPPKHPKFTIKFRSLKPSVQFFTKNHSPKSKKSPDYSSSSTSGKNVLQKYLRMVKHKISQRCDDSVDDHIDQQLQVDDEYGGPCIAGESGRRANISLSGNLKTGFRNLGFRSCPPSIDSSPNHNGVLTSFYSDDLQSAVQAAIAHCKQSNGLGDTNISKDSECLSQRFTSIPAIEIAHDFDFPLMKEPEGYPSNI